MAIDSASKRFSMMDFDLPTQPGMMPPDGSITAPDRLAFMWLYSGIAADSPSGGNPNRYRTLTGIGV